MVVFLKCVAESVVELGVRGLADAVPGGGYACDLASSVWKKYRDRRRVEQIRQDVQEIAAAGVSEVRQAAAEAVRTAAGVLPADQRGQLELFLAQVPAAVRQSLKRPDDVSGRSVPARFTLGSADDVAAFLPGRLPRFRPGHPLAGKPGWGLVELLGVGGFGEVWLARHANMTALAGAVKFCHPAHARELRHESTLINRVMEVARGKPPNIVSLLDVNLDGDAPWLMYEYVPGGDLTDVIRGLARHAPDSRVHQTLGILGQLCTAVAHFHRLAPPLVHRDLKPGNVLVDGTGRQLMVTDFGIGGVAAKAALRGEATTTGRLVTSLRGSHSPLYASPQQRAGAEPDPRDDVHAIGVIAYQLLTGHLAHGPGADYAHDLRDAGTPDGLVELVGACVAANPARRPADAAALLARLQPPPVPAARAAAAGPPVSPAHLLQQLAERREVATPAAVRPVSPAQPYWPVLDSARLNGIQSRAEAVPFGRFEFYLEHHLPNPPPEPEPLPEEIDANRTLLYMLGGVAAVGVVLVPAGVITRWYVSVFGLALGLVFGAWFYLARLSAPYRRELDRRRRAYDHACRDLEAVEASWADALAAHTRRCQSGLATVRGLVARGKELSNGYAAERAGSEGKAADAVRRAEEVARKEFLRAQLIATADIPNIGDGRKQVLAARGILTAADINPWALKEVDGIGPALRNSLLEWKEAVKARFQYHAPPAAGDPAQCQAVYARYRAEMDALELRGEALLKELAALEPAAKRTFAGLLPEVRRVAAEWSQTKADYRLIRSSG